MLSDREYSRQVRLVVGIVLGVVAAIAVAVGGLSWYWHRVAADAEDRQYVRWSMVKEFEGDRPGAVPLGEAPRSFVPGVSDPDVWPVDPISSERVAGLRKAISVYDSLYPKRAVSFESVKRAYGRDLKRNVEQGWKLDKKEHAFIHWNRQYANLVYKRDVVDSDGVIHHKGDKVVLGNPPTNFGYIKGADMEYKDYMFAPGRGE